MQYGEQAEVWVRVPKGTRVIVTTEEAEEKPAARTQMRRYGAHDGEGNPVWAPVQMNANVT